MNQANQEKNATPRAPKGARYALGTWYYRAALFAGDVIVAVGVLRRSSSRK